jgi:hypothetical protein
MRLTGANFFPPFAWAAKPADPSAGGAAENSPQFQLRVCIPKTNQAP